MSISFRLHHYHTYNMLNKLTYDAPTTTTTRPPFYSTCTYWFYCVFFFIPYLQIKIRKAIGRFFFSFLLCRARAVSSEATARNIRAHFPKTTIYSLSSRPPVVFADYPPRSSVVTLSRIFFYLYRYIHTIVLSLSKKKADYIRVCTRVYFWRRRARLLVANLFFLWKKKWILYKWTWRVLVELLIHLNKKKKKQVHFVAQRLHDDMKAM